MRPRLTKSAAQRRRSTIRPRLGRCTIDPDQDRRCPIWSSGHKGSGRPNERGRSIQEASMLKSNSGGTALATRNDIGESWAILIPRTCWQSCRCDRQSRTSSRRQCGSKAIRTCSAPASPYKAWRRKLSQSSPRTRGAAARGVVARLRGEVRAFCQLKGLSARPCSVNSAIIGPGSFSVPIDLARIEASLTHIKTRPTRRE